MRAHLEIAVAHIRGLESLTAVETPIRDFVRHAAASASLALLEDAQVLLMYFGGAMAHGVDEDTRTVTPQELASMHSELVSTVASLRAATDSVTHPVRYARLLPLDALLALHPAYGRMTGPADPAELAELVETDSAPMGDGTTPLTQVTRSAADQSLDIEADERASTVTIRRLNSLTPPVWPTSSGRCSFSGNWSTCFPRCRRSRSRPCRGSPWKSSTPPLAESDRSAGATGPPRRAPGGGRSSRAGCVRGSCPRGQGVRAGPVGSQRRRHIAGAVATGSTRSPGTRQPGEVDQALAARGGGP